MLIAVAVLVFGFRGTETPRETRKLQLTLILPADFNDPMIQ